MIPCLMNKVTYLQSNQEIFFELILLCFRLRSPRGRLH
ncbi:hypothetical protein GXM_08875 [Nostoc sphaeroides CCNUC1]|uniref:Uncharacterized protein n=1 Tax=Nostoc sphaeroides CCNUC1 TaxID=2653204 RepID=A0A5P8WFP0_9NOSO|nr:hypothetical protein GXM_08875 [Nostoc sphaeroides CCNUC1]